MNSINIGKIYTNRYPTLARTRRFYKVRGWVGKTRLAYATVKRSGRLLDNLEDAHQLGIMLLDDFSKYFREATPKDRK